MVMGGRMVCLVQTCSRERNLAVGDSNGAQEPGHVFGHVRGNLLGCNVWTHRYLTGGKYFGQGDDL